MRRIFFVACALAVIGAACGDDTTSSSTVATTTMATTTTAPTTTTSSPTTTTSTVPLAPVTTDPRLPSALSRSLIPIDEIDQGWVAVVYSASQIEPFEEGPQVIYLVSPAGDRYEIAAFPVGGPIPMLGALANDGTHVVAAMWTLAQIGVVSIDIATGVTHTIAEFEDTNPRLGTTLPTGRDVVVDRSTFEPTDEYLTVYRTDGSVFAEIATKGSDWPTYSWLYGLDGTFLVVGDGESLRVVGNDGTFIRTLDAPAALCDAVRWWDQTTILASCVPDPVAETMGYYHVLWLVPIDGSAPTRLTVDPDPEVNVVEFGHADAWRAGDETLLQWWGDCGARGIEVLQPDGTAEWLELEVTDGPWIYAQAADDLVIQTSAGCGDTFGALHLIRTDGTLVRTLVPQVAGYQGVTTVAAMIPTP